MDSTSCPATTSTISSCLSSWRSQRIPTTRSADYHRGWRRARRRMESPKGGPNQRRDPMVWTNDFREEEGGWAKQGNSRKVLTAWSTCQSGWIHHLLLWCSNGDWRERISYFHSELEEFQNQKVYGQHLVRGVPGHDPWSWIYPLAPFLAAGVFWWQDPPWGLGEGDRKNTMCGCDGQQVPLWHDTEMLQYIIPYRGQEDGDRRHGAEAWLSTHSRPGPVDSGY